MFVPKQAIEVSLAKSRQFNQAILENPEKVVREAEGIIQGQGSPLLLSHSGLVITPRIWDKGTWQIQSKICNLARTALQEISEYLATSSDELAVGLRKNMLNGPHYEKFCETLLEEARLGIAKNPYEVGRADILNGGPVEMNTACLDALVDFHDLNLFWRQLIGEIHPTFVQNSEFIPQKTALEATVDTMIAQISANSGHVGIPVLAWIGTATEIYAARDHGGYFPREVRFKQNVEKYLSSIGFKAEVRLICAEELSDKSLVNKISSAYRNLLPEDMNMQSEEIISGLCALSVSNRLIGTITDEIITNKATMAILSSKEYATRAGVFPSKLSEFNKVFPRTSFLSDEYTGSEQLPSAKINGYVFKLSNGEEGRGVWIGSDTPESKISELTDLTSKDKYVVIVQEKIQHFPFEAVVIDLPKCKVEKIEGVSDCGMMYQMFNGRLMPNQNIFTTRFVANCDPFISNGCSGIFKPVTTFVQR